jgi:hypothetical protein
MAGAKHTPYRHEHHSSAKTVRYCENGALEKGQKKFVFGRLKRGCMEM